MAEDLDADCEAYVATTSTVTCAPDELRTFLDAGRELFVCTAAHVQVILAQALRH